MDNIIVHVDPKILSPTQIQQKISQADDLYFWYEGSQILPTRGALFMRDEFIVPILSKKKFKGTINLYSLKAWNFDMSVDGSRMKSSSIVDAINALKINDKIKAISSTDFFEYCALTSTGPIYDFFNNELPQKESKILPMGAS